MANYLKISGAYFEQTPQGLKPVADANVISGLYKGTIPYTEQAPANQQVVGGKSLATVLAGTSAPLPTLGTMGQPTQVQGGTPMGATTNFGALQTQAPPPDPFAGFTPSTPQATPRPQLGAAPKNSLLEFSDMLEQALSLARRKRYQVEIGALQGAGFTPGQVNPGTFAAILGSLEANARSQSNVLFNAAEGAYQTNIQQQQRERELQYNTQMDEYTSQVRQMTADKENIQNLALKLSEAGVTGSQITKFLNTAKTTDDAIKLYTALLPDKKNVTFDQKWEGDTLYEYELDAKTGQMINRKALLQRPPEAVTSTSDFTPTQKLQLEQAGLANAPRQNQLDYLFGKTGGDSRVTPTGGSLSLSEAKSLGLPMQLVGKSEQEVLSDLSNSAPPQWFRQMLEEQRQQSVTSQLLQQEWDKFRNNLNSQFVKGQSSTKSNTTNSSAIDFNNL